MSAVPSRRRPAGVRPTGRDAYVDGRGAYVPDAVRVVRGPDLERDTEVEVDAVVVGTGSGGAVVAKELAEGGMRVATIEEGDRFTTDDYTARPREMSARLFRDAGQVHTVGLPPVLLPMGKVLGGTSLINSATCFRTPPAILEMWRERFGLEELSPESLDPFFRRVERETNVVQVPADIAGRNAEVVRRGAERLGYSGDFVFRNVRGCVGSGVCTFGCPTSAKQHVGITYLPKAWDAGATSYTLTRAERLIVERGRVRGVEARAGSRRLTVRAGVVVVAAGTVHTPTLLRRSDIGGRRGQVGENLSIHPATGMTALFDEQIDMFKGVPQAFYIDQLASEGIMFEGAAGPVDYMAAMVHLLGERHRLVMERYVNLANFGVMVSDTGRGRIVAGRGRPAIRYDVTPADVERFKKGLLTMAEIYWAAGAKAVFPPLDAVPELRAGDTTPLRDHDLKAGELPLIAFHPLGTCRMGADPAQSAVDGDHRVHGVEGLYVADGSVVPSPLGVNPHLTIMCLATRMAYRLLRKDPPVDEPRSQSYATPAVALDYLARAAA